MVSVVPRWVLWFVVSDGISILQICTRPKTFTQAHQDGLYERLVGVIFKKFGKLLNVDIACDFEEVRIVTDCFRGGFVIKLERRRTREWFCRKGVLGSRTNGNIYSTLD